MPRPKAADALNESIHITRSQRRGAYADVVDFAYYEADHCGSAANAVAQAVRSSPGFKEWTKRGTKTK